MGFFKLLRMLGSSKPKNKALAKAIQANDVKKQILEDLKKINDHSAEPEAYIEQLIEHPPEIIVRHIMKTRKQNLQNFHDLSDIRIKLIRIEEFNLHNEAAQIDLLGFYQNYVKAKEAEDHGDNPKAIHLYWDNIYRFGTDAPANFDRLLILLRKEQMYMHEMALIAVFIPFASDGKAEKLLKRRESVAKLIQKSGSTEPK